MGLFGVVVGSGVFILGVGGWWWIYFGWWWVYFVLCWMVVDFFGCWWDYFEQLWVLLGLFWVMVGGGGFILGGCGWWWMVVGGGTVYKNPLKCTKTNLFEYKWFPNIGKIRGKVGKNYFFYFMSSCLCFLSCGFLYFFLKEMHLTKTQTNKFFFFSNIFLII